LTAGLIEALNLRAGSWPKHDGQVAVEGGGRLAGHWCLVVGWPGQQPWQRCLLSSQRSIKRKS